MDNALKAGERKRLQSMIDRTAAASAVYHREQSRLNEWCRNRYGVEPGDIDADVIIDSVFGGCGLSQGMNADDFHAAMTAGER